MEVRFTHELDVLLREARNEARSEVEDFEASGVALTLTSQNSIDDPAGIKAQSC